MLTSVKELHTTIVAHPIDDDWDDYFNYLICRVHSGRRDRYNLIRIDSLCDKMERLGCELTLDHCRRIIKEHEPDGTTVVKHSIVPRKMKRTNRMNLKLAK